jgi:hypothetical protein
MWVKPDGTLYVNNERLRLIANAIYKKTGRYPPTQKVVNFVRNIRGERLRDKTDGQIIAELVNLYTNPRRPEPWIKNAQIDENNMVHDFQTKQINQLADSENQFAYTSHASRKPRDILDDNRLEDEVNMYVENGLKSGICDVKTTGLLGLRLQNRLLNSLNKFFDAETISGAFKKQSNGLTTYDNITLPTQRLLMDSRNRNFSYRDYRWEMLRSGASSTNNGIRMIDDLQQIIAVRIHPFWLPMPNDLVNPQFYKKIRMYIRELSQGTNINEPGNISRYSESYHFEFDIIEIDNRRFHLSPTGDWKANKVINQINSFTIELFGPTDPIQLDRDQFVVTISNTNPAVLTFPENHNLTTTTLIYITGYQSGDNPINVEMNRRKGWTANVTSATQLEISIDLTTVTQQSATVYLGAKRLQFTADFITLEH